MSITTKHQVAINTLSVKDYFEHNGDTYQLQSKEVAPGVSAVERIKSGTIEEIRSNTIVEIYSYNQPIETAEVKPNPNCKYCKGKGYSGTDCFNPQNECDCHIIEGNGITEHDIAETVKDIIAKYEIGLINFYEYTHQIKNAGQSMLRVWENINN